MKKRPFVELGLHCIACVTFMPHVVMHKYKFDISVCSIEELNPHCF